MKICKVLYKNIISVYATLQQMTREIIIEPEATTGIQYDFEYDLYGNISNITASLGVIIKYGLRHRKD